MSTTPDLCIQVDPATGQTVNHPCLVSNILDAFGSMPDKFKPFKRTTFRDSGIILGVYQKSQCTYTFNSTDNIWEDTWAAVAMSDAEVAAKQQGVQTAWAARPNASNFTAWTFDADTCAYVPPVARPADPGDGQTYRWQGSTTSWQLCPSYPTDGKVYVWNFTTWAWVEVTPPSPV